MTERDRFYIFMLIKCLVYDPDLRCLSTLLYSTQIYNSEVNFASTYTYNFWDNLKSIVDEVFIIY